MTKPAAPVAPQSVGIQSPLAPQVEKEKKGGSEASQERFSFNLKEADVRDVLRGLSKQTN